MSDSYKKTLIICLHFGFLLTALVPVFSGCQSTKPESKQISDQFSSELDSGRFRYDLFAFLDEAYSTIIGTTGAIAVETKDRSIRESTLRLRIHTADFIEAICLNQDLRHAFVESWLRITQARMYLKEGLGKTRFGKQQHLVVECIQELEQKIVDLGRFYFSEEKVTEGKKEIEAIAAGHHLSREFFGKGFDQSVSKELRKGGTVSQILHVPISPFSAFGGVRDTPSAIQGATDAVSVMTKVINDFPERTRWQIELLLLEMESFGFISDTLREISEFEKSFNSIAKSAETLPAEMRSEFEKAMKSVEKTQPQIQASLTETQKTVEQVSGTVKQIEKLTGPMNQLAENVNAAGKAWEATAVAINEFVDKVGGSDEEDPPVPSTPAEENESGGIESITEMMEKTTAAAQELRSLVADLNRPMSQKSGIQQVTTNAEGLIETITWRAILLIFAFFTVMAVFRLIMSHFKVLPKSGVNKK